MAGFIKACKKQPLIIWDFWFFAVMAVAVYFGGDTALLLLAALVHEAGHCLALLLTNNGISQLRLCGCCAHIIPYYRRLPSHREELAILAAGPLAGILLAVLSRAIAPRFAEISLMLSVFNLMPVRGLDGGSILRLIFSAIFDEEKTVAADVIGGIISVGIIAASVWSIVLRHPNVPLLGVAAFLFY